MRISVFVSLLEKMTADRSKVRLREMQRKLTALKEQEDADVSRDVPQGDE